MCTLILGATGMLGHSLFWNLHGRAGLEVFASVRDAGRAAGLFPPALRERLVGGLDATDAASIEGVIARVKPQVVVNAVGLIRQLSEGRQPLPCIEINARFPHLLLKICRAHGSRLIHYSTDCVFNGHKGSPYTEADSMSAEDIYGITKYLGEVKESSALTLRTSIIGPELRNKFSLIEWFLAQRGSVKGYRRAIYSGLPTCEHARILAEYVFPNPDLCGLYHVSAVPISKYDLLKLVAREYGKDIEVIPDNAVCEDKRLDSSAFARVTGYSAPAWDRLTGDMRAAHQAWLAAVDSASDRA